MMVERLVEYRQGDLLHAGLPAWGHGVNLEGVMGSGIARQVRAEHPEVFRAYKVAIENGTLQPGGAQPVRLKDGTIVFNMATQIYQGPWASVNLIMLSMVQVMYELSEVGIDRFGIPLIGCGIGGLDWERDVEPKVTLIQAMYPEVQIVVYRL